MMCMDRAVNVEIAAQHDVKIDYWKVAFRDNVFGKYCVKIFNSSSN